MFFKITNVDFEIVHTQDSYPDYYMAATMGELGCWVDIASTKMIQTGIEHSQVIDVSTYLGICEFEICALIISKVAGVADLSDLSAMFPPLDLSDPHFDVKLTRLRELTKAILHPFASDLDLPVSILLKGARGIGKSTCVKWLAQTLGVHLLKA